MSNACKSIRIVTLAGAALAGAMALSGCQSQYLDPGTAPTSPTGSPTPYIVSVSPTTGSVGSAVTIAGINFGATQGSNTVMFGNAAATATSWATNSIVAKVPSGASTGMVVVNAGGLASNGVSFTVTQ
jgi:hypothetical protein